jgi:hypothetical protein
MITNDARHTRGIESRIFTTKAAFNRKETLFVSKLEETSEVLNLEHRILWC